MMLWENEEALKNCFESIVAEIKLVNLSLNSNSTMHVSNLWENNVVSPSGQNMLVDKLVFKLIEYKDTIQTN